MATIWNNCLFVFHESSNLFSEGLMDQWGMYKYMSMHNLSGTRHNNTDQTNNNIIMTQFSIVDRINSIQTFKTGQSVYSKNQNHQKDSRNGFKYNFQLLLDFSMVPLGKFDPSTRIHASGKCQKFFVQLHFREEKEIPMQRQWWSFKQRGRARASDRL